MAVFGRGRGGRPRGGQGTPGTLKCRCPSCGHTEPHTRGVPCYTRKCPKCGSRMHGANC